MITKESEAIAALNDFSRALTDLKNTSKLNIFEAVGMSTQEVKHSAFLAWLLNPKQTHGQGGAFLGDFLKGVLDYSSQNAEIISSHVTQSDVEVLFADPDIEVKTEKVVDDPDSRIDIFIHSDRAKLTVVIENKTFTSTHDNQLRRYKEDVEKVFYGGKMILVYLTPNGEAPKDKDGNPESGWCIFDYSAILDILRHRLAEIPKTQRNSKLRYLTEDYIDMVEDRILHSNSEIRKLCRQIRREHADALEILLGYTDNVDAVYRYLAEQWLPSNVSDIAEKKYDGRKLVFYTQAISDFYAKRGLSMKTSDGTFRFQMSVGSKDGPITMDMWLSKPADENWTDADVKIRDIIQPNKKMGAKYCTLFSVEIMSIEDREKVFEDETALIEWLNKSVELKRFSEKIIWLDSQLSVTL